MYVRVSSVQVGVALMSLPLIGLLYIGMFVPRGETASCQNLNHKVLCSLQNCPVRDLAIEDI